MDPPVQRLHLVGLLSPGLEGGFPPVAGYGSGHYGRFPKDLGGALRCGLILVRDPHSTVLLRFGFDLHPYYRARRGKAHRPKVRISSGTIDPCTMHISAVRT